MSVTQAPDERAPRLLGAVAVVLTGAAGAIDAVTFFAFHQVFASTMTGNLIMLGLDAGRGEWTGALDAGVAILGYCAGLVVGTLVTSVIMRSLPWRNAVGAALTVELAVLVAIGVGWAALADPADARLRAVLLVSGAAAAMGIQAAALRHVGPVGTPTNFVTGVVTNWVSSMVELHRPTWNGNAALRVAAIAVFACLGALAQIHLPGIAYALPVLLVAIALGLMARVTRVNHGGLWRGTPHLEPARV